MLGGLLERARWGSPWNLYLTAVRSVSIMG